MAKLLEEIEAKITFAVGLYADRDGDIDDVEEVYKAEFDVDEDVKDSGLAIVNLPTGQAQVKIHKAYLSLGIDLSIQVLPHDETPTEELADDAEAFAKVADAGFIVGGIGLVAAVILIPIALSGDDEEEAGPEAAEGEELARPVLAPYFGPDGAGMAATWRF